MSLLPGAVPELEPLEAPQTAEERKERQRLHVKRTYYKKLNNMQHLRDTLQTLEQEFERLMEQKRPANQEDESEVLSVTTGKGRQSVSDRGTSTERGLQSIQALLTEILTVKERLRAENDALQTAVREHERFPIKVASWMHVEDLGTSSSDDDPAIGHQVPSVIRLIAPVSAETCREIARETFAEMQLFHQSQDLKSTGVSVFGWRDKRIRVDDHVKFSMEKVYKGVTAQELSLRGWTATVASSRLAQLYSTSLNVKVTTLQRVDSDNEIKLRVMASGDSKTLVKTLLLLSRFAVQDGFACIVRSIDPQTYLAPYADPLGVEEQWIKSCTWISFHEEGDQAQHCRVTFGGEVHSNVVADPETWMIEVLLIALRWESLVVKPMFAIC